MNRIYLDDALQSKLDELRTQTELCDKDGHLLGYFIPAGLSDREIYAWVEAQASNDEIERRKQESGSKTTAEVLEYLRSL